MKPDSLAFINVQLPAGALPAPILAILLIGTFGLAAYALSKAAGLKTYLGSPPFPTQVAMMVAGIIAFLGEVLVSLCRLALGYGMPAGYDVLFYATLGVLGVVGSIGIGKHAFSIERTEAQAKGAAAVAAATPPQPTQVLAAEGSSVNVTTEAQPTGEHQAPKRAPAVNKPLGEFPVEEMEGY